MQMSDWDLEKKQSSNKDIKPTKGWLDHWQLPEIMEINVWPPCSNTLDNLTGGFLKKMGIDRQDRYIDTQISKIDRQIDRQTDRQIDRQVNRQIDRQIHRQIDRQIDRQRERDGWIDKLDRLYRQIRQIRQNRQIGQITSKKLICQICSCIINYKYPELWAITGKRETHA